MTNYDPAAPRTNGRVCRQLHSRPAIGYILTPVTFGGAERVSLNYLKNADFGSFDVQPVLLTRPWEEEVFFASELRKLGLSYRSISVASRPGDGWLRVVRCARELLRICSKARFDLLHTHGYFADIIASPVSHILGIPHISTCHGFVETDSRLRLYCRLDRLALRWCTRVITVSSGIDAELVSGGVRGGRVVTIPNGIEKSDSAHRGDEDRARIRSALGIADSERVIGYAGRLSKEKGIEYLIRAGARVKASGSHRVRILIVGEGPERAALEEVSRKCRIADMTVFAGFQPDARRWIRAMDVFVLPSLTEGTPLALLEAMAEGVPSVATKVGEVPKIITKGIDGLTVEPGDPGGIARAVESLLADESKRVGIAAEAMKTVERRYGIDLWRRSIEEQYRMALRRPRTSWNG